MRNPTYNSYEFSTTFMTREISPAPHVAECLTVLSRYQGAVPHDPSVTDAFKRIDR